jgi:hypothetical protein
MWEGPVPGTFEPVTFAPDSRVGAATLARIADRYILWVEA